MEWGKADFGNAIEFRMGRAHSHREKSTNTHEAVTSPASRARNKKFCHRPNFHRRARARSLARSSRYEAFCLNYPCTSASLHALNIPAAAPEREREGAKKGRVRGGILTHNARINDLYNAALVHTRTEARREKIEGTRKSRRRRQFEKASPPATESCCRCASCSTPQSEREREILHNSPPRPNLSPSLGTYTQSRGWRRTRTYTRARATEWERCRYIGVGGEPKERCQA